MQSFRRQSTFGWAEWSGNSAKAFSAAARKFYDVFLSSEHRSRIFWNLFLMRGGHLRAAKPIRPYGRAEVNCESCDNFVRREREEEMWWISCRLRCQYRVTDSDDNFAKNDSIFFFKHSYFTLTSKFERSITKRVFVPTIHWHTMDLDISNGFLTL